MDEPEPHRIIARYVFGQVQRDIDYRGTSDGNDLEYPDRIFIITVYRHSQDHGPGHNENALLPQESEHIALDGQSNIVLVQIIPFHTDTVNGQIPDLR